MIKIQVTDRGLTFAVTVLPRASKTAIVGSHGDALKIKLTAAPVDGAANKQCILLLAKALRVPKSAVAIVGGQTRRQKQVCILRKAFQGRNQDIQTLIDKLSQLCKKSTQTP